MRRLTFLATIPGRHIHGEQICLHTRDRVADPRRILLSITTELEAVRSVVDVVFAFGQDRN